MADEKKPPQGADERFLITTAEQRDVLGRLALRWMRLAGLKFQDAKREPDAMGARLIEHGAVCYFNCAQELVTCAGLLPQSGKATFGLLLKEFGQDSESP